VLVVKALSLTMALSRSRRLLLSPRSRVVRGLGLKHPAPQVSQKLLAAQELKAQKL
jgi:hypothetical protein